MRRRSHSRRRGPEAIDSTVAGSGNWSRRAIRSASSASRASRSILALWFSYSASWRAFALRLWLRSDRWLPTSMTGLSPAIASRYTWRSAKAITTPMTSGRTAIRMGSGRRSAADGGTGS